MTKCFVVLLMIAIGPVALCQTSAYQDADSNTSIYLANAKANVTYNVSDSKFNIGYLYEPGAQEREDFTSQLADAQKKLEVYKSLVSDAIVQGQNKEIVDDAQAHVVTQQAEVDKVNSNIANARKRGVCPRCEYGLNISGKPSTNLSSQFFQSSNSPASISGGGSFGLHGVFSKDIFDQGPDDHLRDDWLLINVSYTRSTFSTVATGSSSPVAQHFNGFTVLPIYNTFVNLSKVSLLAGVGGGINRTNNTGDMTKVEISTAQSSSGTVTVFSQKDAFLGVYKESIGVPIYSDFVFIPKKLNWLSIDAFERANVVPTNGYAEGGFGIFFAKPGKPTQVLGGFSTDWKNGKNEVAIVAGWSF